MKILITGFDPFDNESINPSYEAVKLIEDTLDGAEIIKAEIPTVFVLSGKILTELIDKEKPDIVVCVGQAGGRDAVTPERVAINIKDARICDNRGNMPIDEEIFEGEREAYFSTLPIKEITQNINAEGIPAKISNTAGTFVCNELMYTLMRYISLCERKMIGGFVHIPYIPEQTKNKNGVFALELERAVRSLEIVLKTSMKYFGERIK